MERLFIVRNSVYRFASAAPLVGNTEAQDVYVNENIALGFEEMWLKFESGEQVLALLGEKEVRARLQQLQSACNNRFDAKSCATQLLKLSVTNYHKTSAELKLRQERPDYDHMERLRHEDYMEMERLRREREWEEEERAFWAEEEKERKMLESAIAPDWKMLREEKR